MTTTGAKASAETGKASRIREVQTRSGVTLTVEARASKERVEIDIRSDGGGRHLLHWGLKRMASGRWEAPPRSAWPESTERFDDSAVRTPFGVPTGKEGARKEGAGGEGAGEKGAGEERAWEERAGEVRIAVDREWDFSHLVFVLYDPSEDRWDNNEGRDYHIELPRRHKETPRPVETVKKEVEPEEIRSVHTFPLDERDTIAVMVTERNPGVTVTLATDWGRNLLLHWGLSVETRYEWSSPPADLQPKGTTELDEKAVQTPFRRDDQGLQRLDIRIEDDEDIRGVVFVLKEVDSDRWLKKDGRDFFVPVTLPPEMKDWADPMLAELADEIIESEMGRGSWTLMHRFNLCHDMLDRAEQRVDALALLFIWLRYSSIRQLDWQRNYNTKPRELGHAMERLTGRIGEAYCRADEQRRHYLRLMMTTLGHGSNGQRVRDEILHIMHRHHIKEVAGHFMEEWHQKLHNNTTPDDVVLCEAYIEFLKSDGDLERFYDTLEDGGVTRERLRSFERPIVSDPSFLPHLKDPLINDFKHFLSILNEVHSGTDLNAAFQAARNQLDDETRSLVEFLIHHRKDPSVSVVEMTGKATETRRNLARLIDEQENPRDLIFLDLALEDFVRLVVEQSLQERPEVEALLDLVTLVSENLRLSYLDGEASVALELWRRLQRERDLSSREWNLKAAAGAERLERAGAGVTDRYQQVLQPKAEMLGRAFNADQWTIDLFSEEVARAQPIFALSMLLQKVNRALRRGADLGAWQIISRGKPTSGVVKRVETLGSVQGERFSNPVALVAETVVGDEEIPSGVVAILTPDGTDVVSHVAIRARNSNVLLAVCHDPPPLEEIESHEGKWVELAVDTAGQVTTKPTAPKKEAGRQEHERVSAPSRSKTKKPPSPDKYALTAKEMDDRKVGGKSLNLKRLRSGIPEWIRLPSSAALPFGVFEKVLGSDANREVRGRYEKLSGLVDRQEKKRGELLGELRSTVEQLRAPEGLRSQVEEAMKESGLSLAASWEEAWTAIKRVWASKWNERAYLSRRARSMPHDDLYMAVLIQEVVDADYSFVIHTANPATGNREEIYAEAVVGLGESLVANHPGQAFAFSASKSSRTPTVLAFPSKSVSFFGKGHIFRSDSSGEDLAQFAGAGLYSSVVIPEPSREVTDYENDRLYWDDDLRREMMEKITEIGVRVEEALGAPQDIEGAFSGGEWFVVQSRPQVGLD
jgi:alpha-glucan,water dikinase